MMARARTGRATASSGGWGGGVRLPWKMVLVGRRDFLNPR